MATNSSMLLSGEQLADSEIAEVVDALLAGRLSSLTLRNCKIPESAAEQLYEAIADGKCLKKLSLTCGTIDDARKARLLARTLESNERIRSLSIHGNPLTGVGLGSLGFALLKHRNLTILDLGDCQLGDDSMPLICDLLPPNAPKPGLQELSLSGNPNISLSGWNMLCVALSSSNSLRALMLDYNKLGDFTVCALTVALAARPGLQMLDLECCGVQDRGAQSLHFLISNYPVRIRLLNLRRNRIKASLAKSLSTMLGRSVMADDPDFYNTIDVTGKGGPSLLPSEFGADDDDEDSDLQLPSAPTLALISSRRSKKRRIRERMETEAMKQEAEERDLQGDSEDYTTETAGETDPGSSGDVSNFTESDREVAEILSSTGDTTATSSNNKKHVILQQL